MGLFGSKDDDAGRGPRDASERERARLEREARRAAREGRPAPAAPPPPGPTAAPVTPVEREEVRAESEQPHARPPEADVFTWDEPAPTQVHETPAAAPVPAPAPAPPAPAPPAPAPPAPAPPAPAPPAPAAAAPAPAAPPVAHPDTGTFEFDAPAAGVRRVRKSEPLTEVPAEVRPPAGGRGRRGGPGRRPRAVSTVDRGPSGPLRPTATRRRRGGRILGLIALLLVGGVAWFANALLEPFAGDGEGSGTVEVVVPGGLSASQIGDLLAAKDVVDSSFFFSLRARLSGDRDKLRAGKFALAKGMSYAVVLDRLTTAPVAAKTVSVTVPEGRSRRETLPIIRDSGLRGDYLRATASVEGFSPRKLFGAPRDTRDLEGFLFPATYELRKSASVKTLVKKQLVAFQENFASVDLRPAKRKNLTAYDVLIIASMIEREAALDRERPLISAVIYNRLKQGIPLGIDATIRFRLNQWTQPLKVSELNIRSDYNTRTRQGLPPGPIGNPGIKSLRAAAKPARSKALYYVVKPCGNGAHAFSDNDAQFQRDVAAYNRARDARGGKDPSTC